MNTALGPIGWVAMAITGLVAAGAALIAMFEEDMGATEGMTAATRAQYYELEALNSEYEEACAKYGENSEEASRLKYQLDDLSAAFEMNRQTVEEFTAEVDALCESVTEISDNFENAMTEINAQETGMLALIQKYEDLASQSELTGAQQKELEAVTKKLTETYPELADQLDKRPIMGQNKNEPGRNTPAGGENMRYYSTMRPVMPGSFPNRISVEEIHNFDTKTFCEEIGREAWGYIDYNEPLTKEQAEAYELIHGGLKTYWCVTTSVDNRGRVIAAITDIKEAVCKPENTSTSTSRKDIYNDWFDTAEEAKAFVEEAKRA